jgi:hypothetical protein
MKSPLTTDLILLYLPMQQPANVLHARFSHYNGIKIGVDLPVDYAPGHRISIHIPPDVVPFVWAANS